MHISLRYFLLSVASVAFVSAKIRNSFAMNEDWVCNVKGSCLACLRLSQCSWCKSENKCFSRKLPGFEDYCRDNTTEYQNHGLSFLENADCSCSGGELKEDCVPHGETTEQKCSGRGACLCGRCVCNPMPDTEHPTKMVLGEYCEYDNFSCDGPRCNEGPYHYLQNEAKTRELTEPEVLPSEE